MSAWWLVLAIILYAAARAIHLAMRANENKLTNTQAVGKLQWLIVFTVLALIIVLCVAWG